MNRCLICFGTIEQTLNDNKVCNKCINKFKEINKIVYYEGKEIFILYEYNDFFKELLYRFKGCYDIELKNAFFNNNLLKMKCKYKKRKIICAPSYLDDDIKRGFNHVKEIAKSINLEIIDCLSKIKEYKQSDKKMSERKNIQKVIRIDKTKVNTKDKILIIDDVATSLSTIKSIIHLLPTKSDIKVLVLASNCRFVADEKN